MTEEQYFREIITDHLIDDKRIKASVCVAEQPRFRNALRIAAMTAACLVILVTTVLTIPSARAEVLLWLGVSSPQDYLTQPDGNRAAARELEALLSAPTEKSTNVVPIPIDRTDSQAVNSEDALRLSDFLYENCDLQLKSVLFDGKEIYQAIQMNGLAGLYLLEGWTNGHETAVPVDPHAVYGLYERGLESPWLQPYLTGEKTLYQRPNAWIIYELSDGTRFGGWFDLYGNIDPYLKSIQSLVLSYEETESEEILRQIEKSNAAYLEQNGVTAVAEITPPEGWEQYLDENGMLTAKVYYRVSVIEEDHGDGATPVTELFYAELGTVRVNMTAYRSMTTRTFKGPKAELHWGSETANVAELHPDISGDQRLSLSTFSLSTKDLLIRAGDASAKIDALGIHDLSVRFTLPRAWTEEERNAFGASLELSVLLNEQTGEWYPQYYSYLILEDGSLLWMAESIEQVPYDLMESIHSITLVPTLRTITQIEVEDEDGHITETLTAKEGETVVSSEPVQRWNVEDLITVLNDTAITLTE